MREIEFRPHIRVLLADNEAGIGRNIPTSIKEMSICKKRNVLSTTGTKHIKTDHER